MTMAEDFETSKKAYQFLAGHMDNWKADQEKANRGRDHTVKLLASEVEDLREKLEKVCNYVKKKHPEDFGGDK